MARSLGDTVHYARELQLNAHALLEDAQLLFDQGRWARAFALSVLAEEEAGKALLAIAEQLPGNDFADFKPNRHEDKLTATALAGIAFLGDLGDIRDKARQIDSGALHREKLAALYVDQGPDGLQSPTSITCEGPRRR
ncbi:AbiV family abortive infection protein [Tessaracoccus sp. HDW20]|uniref:AbiV family abortive infection protein n=1 Tax=Tessaracoccus coleopterorum TaxID=2714950 RepID=UPI0018D323B7|nr:AbiV family abortive infection protein [Tessaracoccus coleopterorum]NHB84894.1 AbiV family abortive infection protein [Tessaracoccus coleopterorum]